MRLSSLLGRCRTKELCQALDQAPSFLPPCGLSFCLKIATKDNKTCTTSAIELVVATQLPPSSASDTLRETYIRKTVTMPTPESQAFLAKKPTVPPTFDGVDYDDQHALKGAQDAVIREQWVKVMMARLVRQEMGKCYWTEGVNHLEKCGHLRGKVQL